MVKYFVQGPPIFGGGGDRKEKLRVNLCFLTDLFFWEGAGLVPGSSHSSLESVVQQVIRTQFFPPEFLCHSTMESFYMTFHPSYFLKTYAPLFHPQGKTPFYSSVNLKTEDPASVRRKKEHLPLWLLL